MTDYIQRDAAIELLKKEAAEMNEAFEELGGESGVYAEAYEDAANMLQDMPAADVAEVVHCRDCKHKVRTIANEKVLCAEERGLLRPGLDDFCSYGEYQTNTGGSNNVAD